ncbi:AraC family transcriptional regulator [Salidesulfovibrio onnuriiensis]|uniref:AraC family transcriptional regulator n=1 Tax=Salidesulfovibrio onnuriiensis TaxID=2583823 RepID=UPI0011CAE5DF|nr:GyrI-like domain-containing protein [Salidesulfovibrio onnuriiensis]
MEVKIEKLAPMHVAYVRHIGPYQECKKAWDELGAWAGPKGLINESAKYLGACYDDPEQTPPEKCRYDACITVPEGTEVGGNVQAMTIEGGDYAVLVHKGPYETLGQGWKAIFMEWLPSSGREVTCGQDGKVCFEQYLNDPAEIKPEDLLTAIHLPLK